MKDRKYSKPDQRYAIYKLDKEVMKKYIEDEDSEDESYIDFNETSEDEDDSINDYLKYISDDEEEFISNTNENNFKNLLIDYNGTKNILEHKVKCKEYIKHLIYEMRDDFVALFLQNMGQMNLIRQDQRNLKILLINTSMH